ncbi:MAG: hypothetical protein IPO57_14840 [Rhodocyclales bacterium]|nr:hypothetical protein [Rhodocyclales bacterium]
MASRSLGVGVEGEAVGVRRLPAFGTAMVGALIFFTKVAHLPDAAFSPDWSALMFFAVVIGGIGTIEGPILGVHCFYFALRVNGSAASGIVVSHRPRPAHHCG